MTSPACNSRAANRSGFARRACCSPAVEERHVTDAVHAQQFVLELNRRVVAQIKLIEQRLSGFGIFLRIHGDREQDAGRTFLHRHAVACTTSGSVGSACETRFCTSTWAMSKFVPRANVTVST